MASSPAVPSTSISLSTSTELGNGSYSNRPSVAHASLAQGSTQASYDGARDDKFEIVSGIPCECKGAVNEQLGCARLLVIR